MAKMGDVAKLWMKLHPTGVMPKEYEIGKSMPFLFPLLGLDVPKHWFLANRILEKTNPGLLDALMGPHGLTILKVLVARSKNDGLLR